MATHDIPILGAMTAPDSSGDVFFEPLETALTLGTAVLGTLLGLTMLAPTGSNIGVYGKFSIPQNYAGTPVLVIRGVIAEAANTLAFGFQQVGHADSDDVNIVLEAEDLAENATWTGYAANDMYEETITLTPAASYTVGDEVFFFLFRDEDQDDQTGEFHLTGLFFRYSDG